MKEFMDFVYGFHYFQISKLREQLKQEHTDMRDGVGRTLKKCQKKLSRKSTANLAGNFSDMKTYHHIMSFQKLQSHIYHIPPGCTMDSTTLVVIYLYIRMNHASQFLTF